MQIRCLDAQAIDQLVSLDDLISWVREAMIATSKRQIELPLRQAMKISDVLGAIGMMPGYLETEAAAGVKLVSLVPPSKRKGSSHLGLMVLYDADGLVPKAILDGAHITTIRTAAASAVATDLLARKDAKTLAIFGAGEQALSHVRALSHIRDIQDIRIWNRSTVSGKLADLIQTLKADGFPARPVETVQQAAKGADIICTVTGAAEPFLFAEHIDPGAHVNLVGSSHSQAREVGTGLLQLGPTFLDFEPSARAQAGEIIAAVEEGVLTWQDIAGEIGDVLSERTAGRANAEQVTIYKSLGIASQDIITANRVYHLAVNQETGQSIYFN